MGESYTYSFSPVGAGVFLFNFVLFPCVFRLIPYGKELNSNGKEPKSDGKESKLDRKLPKSDGKEPKSDGKESKLDRKLPKLDGKGLRFRVFGLWILDLRSGFRSSSFLLFSHSVGFLVISSGVR